VKLKIVRIHKKQEPRSANLRGPDKAGCDKCQCQEKFPFFLKYVDCCSSPVLPMSNCTFPDQFCTLIIICRDVSLNSFDSKIVNQNWSLSPVRSVSFPTCRCTMVKPFSKHSFTSSLCVVESIRFMKSIILWDEFQLNGLHGVISQKIILFITTAVKTSNPT
jgi:hypothetical protein